MESTPWDPGLREDSDIQSSHAGVNAPEVYAPQN